MSCLNLRSSPARVDYTGGDHGLHSLALHFADLVVGRSELPFEHGDIGLEMPLLRRVFCTFAVQKRGGHSNLLLVLLLVSTRSQRFSSCRRAVSTGASEGI